MYVLYLNGLNTGTTSILEKLALLSLAKRNILVQHLPINWYSGESLDDLETIIVNETNNILREHDAVVIVGASAGGSLAINAFAHLYNENVSVIAICSRLHETRLPWWDLRELTTMAHLKSQRPSKSFYDSVIRCSNEVLPNLHNINMQRIISVNQYFDEIVPKRTTRYKGLTQFTLHCVGHHFGIVSGIRTIPAVYDMYLKTK